MSDRAEPSRAVGARAHQSLLRRIPAVNEALGRSVVTQFEGRSSRAARTHAVRQALHRIRSEVQGGAGEEAVSPEHLDEVLDEELRRAAQRRIRRVINATGVIIHTNLGRAVIPEQCLRAAFGDLGGYVNVQASLTTGRRSRRDEHVEALLQEITGCEAATVVNNNAAATLLCLSTLARDREVIVSRGQLIEIGGSFRIPEVMEQSGAILREVGTTNKTHLRDYERAINERTALLLRVHASNYRIIGFTEQVPLADLVALGREHGLPVMDDIGSGLLVDLSPWGFSEEPSAPASMATGADICCFSADKMMGSCQGGIITGRAELVERIRENPLARAVRVDKITLMILEATLQLFLDREGLFEENPTLRMLTAEASEVTRRARSLARALRKAVPELQHQLQQDTSRLGSGSLPEEPIPTTVIALTPPSGNAEELLSALRQADPPVFGRISENRVLLDPRTILPGEERELVRCVQWAVRQASA